MSFNPTNTALDKFAMTPVKAWIELTFCSWVMETRCPPRERHSLSASDQFELRMVICFRQVIETLLKVQSG